VSSKKIKVLQIITRLIVGGAQEHVMYLCDLLDRKRFQVKLISGPQTGSEGELITEVRKRNIDLVILPELVREINPTKDFLALAKLTKYIRKGNFDIVHTNSSKAGILGRLAAKLAGTPIIIHTVHGWPYHNHMGKRKRGLYVALEKWSEKFTHKLITVSDLNIEKGLADGIGNGKKYVTIHSGIDLDRFNASNVHRENKKREWNIDPSDRVVGSITRLSEQKAPADFVRMANEILKDNPKVSFLLVGDGPLRDEIRNLIDRLKISRKIIMTGLRHDIPDLLAVMDVFVLSSLWEGLPRVFPQAMAMGLPIVATNVDGAPEAIKDGVNGFLVPPKDSTALAQRALQLLEDPGLARKMGEAGRKMVYADFCIKGMVKKTENLYLELIENELRKKVYRQTV
jgi:glycosyltransferase involved in cell wall biosynthesis